MHNQFLAFTGLIILPLVSLQGFAQSSPTVQATIQEKAPTLDVKPYGSLEIRHSTKIENTASNGVKNTIPAQEVRPTFGLTMFGEKLDTSFTYIYVRPFETTTIAKVALYNETFLKVFDEKIGRNGDFAIGPYAYININEARSGSFKTADVGFKVDAFNEYAIRGGTLSVSGYLEPVATVLSQSEYKNARGEITKDGKSLSLTDSQKEDFKPKDPTIKNFSGFSLTFKPEGLRKFSAGLGLDLEQNWAPVYKAVENDAGKTSQELDHHATRASTRNKLCVGYKLTDSIKVSNAVYQYLDGYMQRGVHTGAANRPEGGRTKGWENRLTVTATLF